MIIMTDEEMLEFLMTSEFNDTYKPEEYKEFLNRFKIFYRILHGRSSSDMILINTKNQELIEIYDRLKIENRELVEKNQKMEDQIYNLKKPRNISMKERFSGKTKQL